MSTPSPGRKRIALIAHDNLKRAMLEWARYNQGTLAGHELVATGTTGALLVEELGLPVHVFLSGPLGGDQQIGAAIAEGRIDVVIFFWDPLEPHSHDVDVKALLGSPSSTTCPSRATARPPTICSRARCSQATTSARRASRPARARRPGSRGRSSSRTRRSAARPRSSAPRAARAPRLPPRGRAHGSGRP